MNAGWLWSLSFRLLSWFAGFIRVFMPKSQAGITDRKLQFLGARDE
jgi:hypothetical protein